VDGADGWALDGSAEQTPDGAWAVHDSDDCLARLQVAQHEIIFAVVRSVHHGWYSV